jgi:hypothetical protein
MRSENRIPNPGYQLGRKVLWYLEHFKTHNSHETNTNGHIYFFLFLEASIYEVYADSLSAMPELTHTPIIPYRPEDEIATTVSLCICT